MALAPVVPEGTRADTNGAATRAAQSNTIFMTETPRMVVNEGNMSDGRGRLSSATPRGGSAPDVAECRSGRAAAPRAPRCARQQTPAPATGSWQPGRPPVVTAARPARRREAPTGTRTVRRRGRSRRHGRRPRGIRRGRPRHTAGRRCRPRRRAPWPRRHPGRRRRPRMHPHHTRHSGLPRRPAPQRAPPPPGGAACRPPYGLVGVATWSRARSSGKGASAGMPSPDSTHAARAGSAGRCRAGGGWRWRDPVAAGMTGCDGPADGRGRAAGGRGRTCNR